MNVLQPSVDEFAAEVEPALEVYRGRKTTGILGIAQHDHGGMEPRE